MRQRGLLIVLSSPSGAGKTTVARRLLEKEINLKVSISYTTRKKRKEEKDGVDYFFVSESEFLKMKSENKFLEWAKVFGAYYGTSKELVKENLSSGKDVLLTIDVQGGLQVKEKYPDSVFIFLLPPSLEELKKRLKERGTETDEEIERRLKVASWEVERGKAYDYVVINEKIEEATDEILSIIKAERAKIKRRGKLLEGWIK